MSKEIEIGFILKPHGVKGAVQLQLHNPASSALERTRQLILSGAGREPRRVSFVLEGTAARGGVLVKIPGVDGRDEAEALRGAAVSVDREALGDLAEGEYLYADLVGCEVQDEAGLVLGLVERVFEAGASDVLVVRGDGKEYMIPLVEQWVQDVDLEQRRVRVRGGETWRDLASVI